MAPPDARTRSTVALNPSKVVSTSLPKDFLPRLLFSDTLLVVALGLGKDFLLNVNASVFWVVMRVLACGGLAVLVWEGIYGEMRKKGRYEWSVLGVSSLLVFVKLGCLMTALFRTSFIRTIIFTHFSTYWIKALVDRTSTPQTILTVLAFAFSFLSDASFSPSLQHIIPILPTYGVLLIHGLSSAALDHTEGVLGPSLGPTTATAANTLGATLICMPIYLLKRVMNAPLEPPDLPLTSFLALPLLAFSLLYVEPTTRSSHRTIFMPARKFAVSYPFLLVLTTVLGPLAFSQSPSWTDMTVGCLLFYGLRPDSSEVLKGPRTTPKSRLIKAYVKTILANPESRKIFYFLVLNLCFMLVQMLYGVWTNSLGLISDAIHMAFDCMAIAMGLFASVMATWPPNERFTYGYARIETLSGFANGIFLILISIFIVFEAVQRIIDPPEMNTSQLLLVSSLGLGVNLFGMFAMGGHHHHGHSHSHGHSHGHSSPTDNGHGHGHSHDASTSEAHQHSPHIGIEHHDHDHDHHHGHGHKRTPSTSPNILPIVSRSSSYSSCTDHQDHEHEHGHGHHDHDHDHAHHDHAEHNHEHGHGHGHEHHDHDCGDTLCVSHPAPRSSSHSPVGNGHARSHEHKPSLHITASPFSSNTVPVNGVSRPHSHTRTISASVSHPSSLPLLQPQPNKHTHSTSHSHSRTQSQSLPHSHNRTVSISTSHLARITQSSLPSPGSGVPDTPLTPSYQFGHDAHFAAHHHHDSGDAGDGDHHSHHVPNLHDHSHKHAPDHHEGHSHNMRGVFLHVMADTLGSVGVIISTLLIQFYGWTGFDPIASLFIAILIAASVVPLVIDCGRVLCLDVGERESGIKGALAELNNVEGLSSYSSARFWPKDSSSLIGSIHVQLAPSAASYDPAGPHSSVRTTYSSVDRVVERVDSILRKRISGLEELTIQVDALR